MSTLENYFKPFRDNVVGSDILHPFQGKNLKILYADWAASGRLYHPIESYMRDKIGPFVANTHTETSLTGRTMTNAYHQAKNIIKQHVGAKENDVLLFDGFGMTAAINKFQRLLNLRSCRNNASTTNNQNRPLIIITHMEHHSNQISWLECDVDLLILRPDENGLPDLNHLEDILRNNQSRSLLLGSFSACSNVTGIFTPYHEMATLMHRYGGYACVDFSGSAPYVNIDMHPQDEDQRLDAIYFSPHKFLGGPGSSGILVFDKKMYKNTIPDHPGGGTVTWTDPWGGHIYADDIESREDGGTPGFLQAIRASLSVLLKEQMGVEKMLARENQQKQKLFAGIQNQKTLTIFETQQMNRLGFISFYAHDIHHNLFVRLLNDYFGIQVRGGCSCAGTYGHILFDVKREQSQRVAEKIKQGDLSNKPGWVRISLHPVMSDQEIEMLIRGINAVTENYTDWAKAYRLDKSNGEFHPIDNNPSYFSIKECFASN